MDSAMLFLRRYASTRLGYSRSWNVVHAANTGSHPQQCSVVTATWVLGPDPRNNFNNFSEN